MERKFHVSNKKSLSRVRSARRRPGCIRLFVCPTTGGRMEISVSPRETVFGLKAALARKLRVSPSKISLIYKDKVLKDGCIQDHNILDDSQVTLLPNLESGLSINRSDRSIIQALENLTETQVNDFLSGRSPLMLAIRMGENMVFVQLQLSMLHPAPQRSSVNPSTSTSGSTPPGGAQTNHVGTPATATSSNSAPQVRDRRSQQAPPAVTLNSTSAFAEATRCLSQRLNRLQELNCNSQLASRNLPTTCTGLQPPTEAAAGLDTPPASPAPPTSSSSTAPSRQHAHQTTTAFPLPPTPVTTTEAPHGTGTTSALSSVPVGAVAPLSPPPSPGAIIDSMRSLGRGIYSGTFQGTLDPSLQDGQGRPRRSVNTILHILNDLLVAAPSQPQPQPQAQPGQAAPARTESKVPGLLQKPMNVLTPPPSPTARTSAVHTKPMTPNLITTHQSSASPVAMATPTFNAPASEVEENPDNALLRGKMQRVQMMLAQRKEQRRTRREITGPYYNPNSLAAPNVSTGNRHAAVSMNTGRASRNQIVTPGLPNQTSTLPSPLCMAAPMSSSSSSSSSSPSMPEAMDDSSCMEELQHHQHQQNQQPQQQQPSRPSCRNSGEYPCQTCTYCNPSREQDSLAV